MTIVRVVAAAALVPLVLACGSELPPRGQIVLHVTTDAPLPSSDGVAAAAAAEPLFDTVRFDVHAADGSVCADCTRIHPLDMQSVAAGEVSMGIVPGASPSSGRVRLRMYLRAVELAPEPSWYGTVDVWAAVPPIVEDEVQDYTVILPTDAVGKTVGSIDTPVEPIEGWPEPALPGSWAAARRVHCASPPGPDEACVPGGAFWMGHPVGVPEEYVGDRSDLRRIVVLSPFYVDATEVTVASFRAAALAGAEDPVRWNEMVPDKPPVLDDPFWDPYCTFTDAPSERDGLPVVCVTKPRAAAYCAAHSRELPSEAQLEYLESGLRGRAYPWGDDAPSCDDAVWGRWWPDNAAGVGVCREQWMLPAPSSAGTAARDSLLLGTVTVVDLAGNVAEWARDLWNRQDEPCWGGGVRHDPVCTSPSAADGLMHMFRGFSWSRSFNHAARRYPAYGSLNLPPGPDRVVAPFIGFRCARAAAPAPD
jgi:formylglycine-generating enzyme required for sulfatase activity